MEKVMIYQLYEGSSRAVVSLGCCGDWEVEFHTNYEKGDKLRELAEYAWNDAPRVTYINS